MTLPVGQISFGQVNTELGLSATAQISLNDAAVRTLAGVSSGAIAMSNLQGKSNAPTVIGQAFGGGFWSGTFQDGASQYYLIVGPAASTQASQQFKTTNTNTLGSTAVSVIAGPANNTAIKADTSNTYPAVNYCTSRTAGGYTDWYLPAKNELELCYFNLKPYDHPNAQSSGNNPDAVPPHGNYTPIVNPAVNPAVTSAALFQSPSGSERFLSSVAAQYFYWSSTVASYGPVRNQSFRSGNQNYNFNQIYGFQVRAVRRILA